MRIACFAGMLAEGWGIYTHGSWERGKGTEAWAGNDDGLQRERRQRGAEESGSVSDLSLDCCVLLFTGTTFFSGVEAGEFVGKRPGMGATSLLFFLLLLLFTFLALSLYFATVKVDGLCIWLGNRYTCVYLWSLYKSWAGKRRQQG